MDEVDYKKFLAERKKAIEEGTFSAKDAKESAIKLWSFLAEDGRLEKRNYPFQAELALYKARCSLCTYFDLDNRPCRVSCPLGNGGCSNNFYCWNEEQREGNWEKAKSHAEKILALIEGWDISEEEG